MNDNERKNFEFKTKKSMRIFEDLIYRCLPSRLTNEKWIIDRCLDSLGSSRNIDMPSLIARLRVVWYRRNIIKSNYESDMWQLESGLGSSLKLLECKMRKKMTMNRTGFIKWLRPLFPQLMVKDIKRLLRNR